MPRITNNFDLPLAVVNAIKNDGYSKGAADISVTSMIGPARKRRLEIDHTNVLYEDASDRIWALFGTIVHHILEQAEDPGAIKEQRLFIKRHGWTISGKFDHVTVEKARLSDYKTTSVYAVMEEPKSEWIAQANIYRLMLRECLGIEIEELQIVALMRDWRKIQAKTNPDYPQSAIYRLPLPLWAESETETYITGRLRAHGLAQTILPDCTPEERWEKPSFWSLMRQGNTRATARFEDATAARDALEAASAKLADASPKERARGYYLQKSEPTQTRCADYCVASSVCSLWHRLESPFLKTGVNLETGEIRS